MELCCGAKPILAALTAPDALGGTQRSATLIVAEMAPAEIWWLVPGDIDAARLCRQVNDPGGPSPSNFHSRREHALAADGSALTFEAGEQLPAERIGP